MTTILDRIAERLGYVAKTQTISPVPEWLQATGNAQRFSVPEPWLPENQLQLYQRLSWVAIAVGAIASSAATTALSVKQMVGEEERDIPNHEFEKLLQRPNPLMSRYELLEATISFRALTGNSYWWLNRTSEKQSPSEIWILPSHTVRPVPDGRLFLRGYLYDPGDGTEIPLEPWEIVHFKRFHPLNTFVGLSPIEALATVAEGDLAMQRWNTNFFGEGNAKVPGALAFADPIDDSSWSRMKEDIKREHGGTKRNLMMLRNVGKGGVEWVSMAMSQKDMEFLNARDKTKEEIFAMYAPGLASILAINATEANSTAGRATFNELAVWPQLTAIAEKITNDVLIAYGDNLKAEFDDIRGSDKAMDMAEQNVYALTHTIDEVRQRYYGDMALGDERGTLLVAQVGQATGKAEQPEQPTQPGQAEPMPAIPETDTDPDETEREEEVAKFQRWASKRKQPDPDKFSSDILTRAEKAAILRDLQPEADLHWHGDATKQFQIDDPVIDPTLLQYEEQLQALIEEAVTGEIDKPEFEQRMREIVLTALLLAFLKGHKGTEEELSVTARAAFAAQRNRANESIASLSGDIYNLDRFAPRDGRNPQTESQGIERAFGRIMLWVSALAGVYALGQLYADKGDGQVAIYYRWELGRTSKHCSDCLRLNGQVHTQEEWLASGWQPQGRNLECGGWNCDCRLVRVDGLSRGNF